MVGTYRALVTAVLALLGVSVVQSWRPSRADLEFAFAIGLLVGILFGGALDAVFHYVLRLLLWVRGYAWLQLPAQLAKAERLTVVGRAGGGYLFAHEVFLEHLSTTPIDT